MIGIDLFGAVSLRVFKMNAEYAVKAVVTDLAGTVGHAVHGGCVLFAAYAYPYRAAMPGSVIAAAGLFHGSGVGSSQRLSVNVIQTAGAFYLPADAGLDIRYYNSCSATESA